MAYEIVRNDGTTSTTITAININFTSYIDNGTGGLGLTPETAYTYTLHAYSDTLKQNEINFANITASVMTSKMIKPSITSGKFNINTKQITLTWNNSSRATAGSEIRRDNAAGTTVAAINTTGTSVTFSDSSIGASTQQYVVISTGLGGLLSDGSVPVTVTPVTAPAISTTMTNGVARVTWGSFAPIAQFNLERAKYNVTTGIMGRMAGCKFTACNRCDLF